MKKLISILVAFAMMAMLAVTASFAAYEDGAIEADTPDTDVATSLVKELQIPKGTTFQDSTYTFDFDGSPAVQDVTVTITAAEVAAATADANNIVTIKKHSAQLFTGVQWPKAGTYTYTVTESEATQLTGTGVSQVNSEAEYLVTVVVANKSDKSGLYIQYIAVEQKKDDAGDPVTGEKVKVNPTKDSDANGFKFINTASQRITGGTDGSGLQVKKIVTGDHADLTKEFPFTVAVTLPTIGTETNTQSFKYKVVKDGTAGEVQTKTANFTISENLGDGDYIEFVEVPVGTQYAVAETTDEDYTATYIQTVNSNPGSQTTYTAAVEGSVTVGTDKVEVTNECTITDEEVTPEGILISNLPYIALALVAIGGLVAYVVIRRRNADEA